MSFQPIFLIGPARSGTKMLRDSIATHPQISKVGYDINFVWKLYNENVPHDALTAEHASGKVKKYLRGYLLKESDNKPFIVEKTVSNCLRVPFLLEIFPDAKFVFLIRDGRDTVESVIKQWNSAPKRSYLVKKFFSVPFLKILPYVFNYTYNMVMIKLKLRVPKDYVWGVKYEGYEEDLKSMSVIQFCARQWVMCINAILEHNTLVPEKNRMEVRYEHLITDKDQEFKRISEFLGLKPEEFDLSKINSNYKSASKNTLKSRESDEVDAIIGETMAKLGYEV